jgi:putative ABC transport system substrate-binding protein
MKRRTFTCLAGVAAIWPALARSQRSERMRVVGFLFPSGSNDWQSSLAAFKAHLQELGWTEGKDIRFEERLNVNNEQLPVAAQELIALSPDVIFVTANPGVAVLIKATRTIPIVFASVSDSVGSGFVASLAHPSGNVTGFHNFEPSIAGKWLELLKQMAPGVRRVAVVYDPQIVANVAFLEIAEHLSGSTGVTVSAVRVHDAGEMEPAITAFAMEPGGGLIVAPNPINSIRRELLVGLATRLKLPAIYPFRFYPELGGLACYGIDRAEQVREAAAYVDRILRGTKPGDLPVQLPTKFEFVINLRTAKVLGLNIPEAMLLRADLVIR